MDWSPYAPSLTFQGSSSLCCESAPSSVPSPSPWSVSGSAGHDDAPWSASDCANCDDAPWNASDCASYDDDLLSETWRREEDKLVSPTVHFL